MKQRNGEVVQTEQDPTEGTGQIYSYNPQTKEIMLFGFTGKMFGGYANVSPEKGQDPVKLDAVPNMMSEVINAHNDLGDRNQTVTKVKINPTQGVFLGIQDRIPERTLKEPIKHSTQITFPNIIFKQGNESFSLDVIVTDKVDGIEFYTDAFEHVTEPTEGANPTAML